MTSRFDGKVAIVTGGATGIGGAISRRLAKEGASVLISDINEPLAQDNVKRIVDSGGIADSIRTDVGIHDDVRLMVNKAVEKWGRLDILVSNAFPAGDPINGSALDVTEQQWDRGMAVLTKSIFLGAKYAVPEMEKQGGGNIVNMASVHGLLMAKDFLVYEAGKSAVIGMTKQMAIDFGPLGIRVNAIYPGHIVTENMQANVWADNPSGLKFLERQYPLRRTGTPDDIANAVAFLCSDDASFITGHALAVDGGHTVQLQENFGVDMVHYLKEAPETQMPY